MAKFRNSTAQRRYIIVGVHPALWVDPDAVVEIDDEDAPAYECQPEMWVRIDGPAVPAKKIATTPTSPDPTGDVGVDDRKAVSA